MLEDLGAVVELGLQLIRGTSVHLSLPTEIEVVFSYIPFKIGKINHIR